MSSPSGTTAKLWRYAKLAAGAILLAIVVIFATENAAPATVRFLSWEFELSLSLLIFFVFVIGVSVGMITAGLLRWRRTHRTNG